MLYESGWSWSPVWVSPRRLRELGPSEVATVTRQASSTAAILDLVVVFVLYPVSLTDNDAGDVSECGQPVQPENSKCLPCLRLPPGCSAASRAGIGAANFQRTVMTKPTTFMNQTGVAVARILSMLAVLERRVGFDVVEKDERSIFYFVVDRLAAGHTVWLADIANSGLTSRPSVYRHVRNLVKKNLLVATGSMPKVRITLALQFSGYDRAFFKAVAKLKSV